MHWNSKILIIGFILFLLQPTSVFAQDSFDNAQVIEIGSNVSFYSSDDGEHFYRVWFNEPGNELIVDYWLSRYDYLEFYNPNKIKLVRVSNEGTAGIVTDRGWHYIKLYASSYTFNVTANPPNPNKVKLSAIDIIPSKAYISENIAISFAVENNGKFKDEFISNLIIDGIIEKSEIFVIGGNDKKDMTFDVVAKEKL